MATRAQRKAARRNDQPKRLAMIEKLPSADSNYAWGVRANGVSYRTDPPTVREDWVEVYWLRGPGAPPEGTPLGAKGTVQWDNQAMILVWKGE